MDGIIGKDRSSTARTSAASRSYSAPRPTPSRRGWHVSAVEDDELTDSLDIASGNPYYDMQDALELPDHREVEQKWKTNGVWALYQTADWIFSSLQAPFLVTETNARSIGMAWDNRPAYDGQWRQAVWALVSRGARMVEYWHWHTLHFGTETYWGGVLPHSGKPGRTYAELAHRGTELETAGALVAGAQPDADITMLYSTPSKWLMLKYLPLGSAPTRALEALRSQRQAAVAGWDHG